MKKSAGILLYKNTPEGLRFLIVHPGGPFWKHKDEGAWSIPKGEFEDDENAFDAAIRELEEETGLRLQGDCTPLSPVKLKSGKVIYAWAAERDFDTSTLRSNTFDMEWPPKSGKKQSFPEVDRAGWFSVEEVLVKINPAQAGLLLELHQKLI
ncbi:MAG: NUDIX hydrolase [Flavobacterium sp. BFFFF1]|uniref:NUDIX domain-containing protein n=1 Tax=Flavobacterium sp. BFFFF1 TaxID=2015557 RepID=UPI000BD4343D|nr:NUDIX domain-containing protein [Flavobacterium sp. BFFFF1]OYU79234.1 MAG: NUDIX hydrolase [Flavobacterium sp. BFFFF1]